MTHNLQPFKPITYYLSSEKPVSKFAFQNATCSATPRGLRDQDVFARPAHVAYTSHSRRGGGATSARTAGRVNSGRRTSDPAASAAAHEARPQTTSGGGFERDRFGRRVPRSDPTPGENARKFKELRDGWNHRTAGLYTAADVHSC
jgi:hypothetical protein